MRKHAYSKRAGAVQEALIAPEAEAPLVQSQHLTSPVQVQDTAELQQMFDALDQVAELPAPGSALHPRVLSAPRRRSSLPAPSLSVPSLPPLPEFRTMLWTTIPDGQRALIAHRSGKTEIVDGPRRLWTFRRRVSMLERHVAHPGDYLVVRHRDGTQEHVPGPASRWLDPRIHLSIEVAEALPIAANEAVVVYAEEEDGVTRRVTHGPATFVPGPGEWLHTFSWHGPAKGASGYTKVPGALEFQKLWLMPDQMYHDVVDVRTGDDAVLTVRLMLFYELVDIERMLKATHDPIGDFVNAATSDVVDFAGKRTFDELKRSSDRLNNLATYPQLVARAEQSGTASTRSCTGATAPRRRSSGSTTRPPSPGCGCSSSGPTSSRPRSSRTSSSSAPSPEPPASVSSRWPSSSASSAWPAGARRPSSPGPAQRPTRRRPSPRPATHASRPTSPPWQRSGST